LEDKHIVFLFKHCLESLLNPGGILFCTNVSPDNPQKPGNATSRTGHYLNVKKLICRG
jgi:hypothetical protein